MFKKLLSNLPFNPSLIGQVGFYAKRLRAESSFRRLGVAFLVLAFGVQIFAAAVPSEPTLAQSNNDIVYGGFTDKGKVVEACNNNTRDFRTIVNHFGIDCLRLFAANDTNVNSNAYGGQLYSLGRIAYGFPGETSVFAGGTQYFMRPLNAWGNVNYKVLQGTRLDGTPFMIIYDCGNIVIVGAPTPPPPPPPPPPPVGVACSNLIMSVNNKAKVATGTTVNVRGQAVGKNLRPGERADMYYQMVDASGKVVSEQKALGIAFANGTAQDSTSRPFKITKAGDYRFRLTVKYESGTKEASGSRAGNCIKEISASSEPCKDVNENEIEVCLEQHKKALNITKGNTDANGTTVNPGDELTYTLSVTNKSSNTTAKKYVIEENIGDILDYADVANLHGGTINQDNTVTWPATDIAPGKTIEKQVTVKVKAVIPETPSPASNPGSFDCKMTNVYGDTIEINVPCSPAKTTEIVSGSLPNTGPGETLAVAFIVTTVAGYFLARSRLMAKELDIVRTEYATSGGNQ
jgi:uncharacterized repeat protein (TIGR01451 family)